MTRASGEGSAKMDVALLGESWAERIRLLMHDYCHGGVVSEHELVQQATRAAVSTMGAMVIANYGDERHRTAKGRAYMRDTLLTRVRSTYEILLRAGDDASVEDATNLAHCALGLAYLLRLTKEEPLP